MCARVLHVWVLLWVGGGGISPTRGEVVTLGKVTVEAGSPFELHCNITTTTGEVLRQVRWLDPRDTLLLSYIQAVPARVSHQEPGVTLITSLPGASTITVHKARPEDDRACYRCLFDVFPTGTQEGSTCLRIYGGAHLQGNRTAVSGQLVVLSCWYTLPDQVRQVVWSKTPAQGKSTTVASRTKYGHHLVEEPFKDRVNLSHSLGDTQLSIRPVQIEDEACYTCEFRTLLAGFMNGTACLTVHVLPKTEMTHATLPSGVTEANCTARSRPAANIAWKACGYNGTLEPPISWVVQHGNGTSTVTSTLTFPSALLAEVTFSCVVTHPGLTTPITVLLSPSGSHALVVLLSVCIVLSILMLCICVCLCKRCIWTDG